jgi:hypothetical protein
MNFLQTIDDTKKKREQPRAKVCVTNVLSSILMDIRPVKQKKNRPVLSVSDSDEGDILLSVSCPTAQRGFCMFRYFFHFYKQLLFYLGKAEERSELKKIQSQNQKQKKTCFIVGIAGGKHHQHQ